MYVKVTAKWWALKGDVKDSDSARFCTDSCRGYGPYIKSSPENKIKKFTCCRETHYDYTPMYYTALLYTL